MALARTISNFKTRQGKYKVADGQHGSDANDDGAGPSTARQKYKLLYSWYCPYTSSFELRAVQTVA